MKDAIGLTQPNCQSPSPRLRGGLRGVWEGHPCPDTPAESGNYNIECVSPLLYTLRSAPIHRDSKLEREGWGASGFYRHIAPLERKTEQINVSVFVSGRGDLAPTITDSFTQMSTRPS